jgi:PPOX class probable F420-dependent enzyme
MIDQLTQQQYLNLETFRKSGDAVRTPVWFVENSNDDTFYVRTVADSGKVKRIRNNDRVNIAACRVDGVLLGDWLAATAREVKDNAIEQKVNKLLDQKYGVMKKIFGMASAAKGRKYTIIELKVEEQL